VWSDPKFLEKWKSEIENKFSQNFFIVGNEFGKRESLIFDVDFYVSDLKKRKTEHVTVVPYNVRRFAPHGSLAFGSLQAGLDCF